MENWDAEMSNAKGDTEIHTWQKYDFRPLRLSVFLRGCEGGKERAVSLYISVFLPLPSLTLTLPPSKTLSSPVISHTSVLPSQPYPVLTKLPQKPSHILILFGTGNNRPGADFIQDLEGNADQMSDRICIS